MLTVVTITKKTVQNDTKCENSQKWPIFNHALGTNGMENILIAPLIVVSQFQKGSVHKGSNLI